LSFSSKLNTLLTILKKPSILCFYKNEHLIVLSHMRSRSSVFSHILGSNPDVIGYGELQLPYRGLGDLLRVRTRLKEDISSCFISNKYLYDKVLHDNLVIHEDFLGNSSFKFIILLREPESTIKSIVNMGHKIGETNYQSIEWATEYYISRIESLVDYSYKLKGRYYFLDSDTLIDDSDELLSNVSSWLSLGTPLSSSYKVFEKTGTTGHGDPLENIQKGKLVKTKVANIEIQDSDFVKATNAYNKSIDILKANSCKV